MPTTETRVFLFNAPDVIPDVTGEIGTLLGAREPHARRPPQRWAPEA